MAAAGGRKLSLFDNSMAQGGITKVTGTPTIISAALYFAELPDRKVLEEMMQKLRSFDSLSAQPVNGRWEPCQKPFDLSRHLLMAEVPGEDELVRFVENAMLQPLSNQADGPWWEVHAVSTRAVGARSLLFFRVEHACADGLSLLQVLSKLATNADGTPLGPFQFQRPRGQLGQPGSGLCQWLSSAGTWLCSALSALAKYVLAPIGRFDTQVRRPHAGRLPASLCQRSRRRGRGCVLAHPLDAGACALAALARGGSCQPFTRRGRSGARASRSRASGVW